MGPRKGHYTCGILNARAHATRFFRHSCEAMCVRYDISYQIRVHMFSLFSQHVPSFFLSQLYDYDR